MTWMKDEWSRQYEHSFVQTTLLSPIIRLLQQLKIWDIPCKYLGWDILDGGRVKRILIR